MDEKKFTHDVEDTMKKALEGTRHELSGLRTSKASPALLDTVRVDYYGTSMPVHQLAQVGAPEPRLLLVTPYDKSALKAIASAIRASELGLNPQDDGNIIRVPIPVLSEERRREMVKLVARLVEEGRVRIRQVRRDANERLKKLEKDGHVSEDEIKRIQDQVQKLTDGYIKNLDDLLAKKQAEVMEV
ncbi:MAG TPA: ribosome recycling factor [Candidatus Saccharimonadales bacterium]|nr:ribosome recycling factor [Candidatus Saccharimonadales bacterium]